MLILPLVVGSGTETDTQTTTYLLKFSFPVRRLLGLIFAFPMPPNQTPRNRASGGHLVSLLYFGKNAYRTKLRITQQEHTLGCQLKYTARD